MKNLTESRTLPYTAKQLYDLAIDIESYPEFIPLCKRASVGEATQLPNGTNQFGSVLVFRYRKFGIYEEFESQITADPNNTTILSVSDGPPFTSFNAKWSFTDTSPEEALAEIEVSYEFRSKALALFIDRVAGAAIGRLITAWEDRAAELYGTSNEVVA